MASGVDRVLDLQFGSPELMSHSDRASWICSNSPKFEYLAMLVNSQLVCFWPVGIVNPIMCDLNYWFQGFAVAPLALVL